MTIEKRNDSYAVSKAKIQEQTSIAGLLDLAKNTSVEIIGGEGKTRILYSGKDINGGYLGDWK